MLKPFIFQEYISFAKIGYCKRDLFHMVSNLHIHFDIVYDISWFIQGAISIVTQDRSWVFLSLQFVLYNELLVNTWTGTTRINQGCSIIGLGGVNGC